MTVVASRGAVGVVTTWGSCAGRAPRTPAPTAATPACSSCSCAKAAPTVSNAGHYLPIVLEHAYRRRAQHAATLLLQAAETGPLTALHTPWSSASTSR